jgi:bifunctional non-homologous end joining protein LigD
LVVDLDPGEPAGLQECARVALLVRERLAADGLQCAPVTSGSKGIHLYAALDRARSSDEVRDYARQVAEELAKEHKALVVSEMAKARRGGKVFLDWSQNVGAKTTISPYSLRGRHRPYVAAPRTWEEIVAAADDPLAIDQLVLDEVLQRIGEHGDIFARLLLPG